jgi:hypothetical protein
VLGSRRPPCSLGRRRAPQGPGRMRLLGWLWWPRLRGATAPRVHQHGPRQAGG